LPLEASQVSADGLQWPLQRAHLNARGFTSISNISSAAEITVEVHSGCVVVFVGGEESR
jgi:thiamine pyrophosphokinase